MLTRAYVQMFLNIPSLYKVYSTIRDLNAIGTQLNESS